MDLQQLLTECAKRKASDLHLKAGSKPIVRIHGHLEIQDDLPPVNQEFVRRAVMTLLGEQRYDLLLQGREIDMGYRLPGVGRFRVNAFLSQGEVRAVFRHVPEGNPTFQDLYLPKVLERLGMDRRGMILVTGITGSGKSTTLAAMINFMNRNRNDHVITIEDPIEYVYEDNKCVISQREVGQDSLGFAQALRAALREDPDIILVGEMRDLETMEVALHAAETTDIPAFIAAGQSQYGMQSFDQSLLQLHREELITYETARDAATNPDDFDLKVKGIFSTGEMTWETEKQVVPPSGGRSEASHFRKR